MIADLKPYAEYKESDSPWLGRMPQHWNLVRLGSVLRERREANEEKQVTQVLSVLKDVGVIRYEDKGNIGNKKSEDIGRYKIVRPDDIVVNCMNVIIGSVGRSRYTGCLSPVYYVLVRRSEADDPRYFAAIFSAKPFHESLVRIGNGILAHRMRIPMELLKCELFPVPPPDEQAAIVRFLNWANGRLERAIRAKRKVIALLNEKKQAIIHRAVTRGLDPSAPLKPSGIPWLGDIPRHWELTALRRYWRVTDCKHLTVPFVDDGIPLASVVEVQSFSLNLSRCKRTRPDWYRVLIEGDRKPKRGDLIYCRNASVGACALVETDIDFAMGQDVCLIRSQSQNQRFLNYLFHSPFMEHQLELLLVGSTFKRINISEIKALAVIVPPKREQDAICESLDAGMVAYDTAISRLEREIELLREYRTRLVADVVTGKLDLRAAAAKLPEETLSQIAEDEVSLDDETEVADEEAAV